MVFLKLAFFLFMCFVMVIIMDKFEKDDVPPGAIEEIQRNMFRDIKDIPQDEYNELMTEIESDLDNRREKIRREG